jgi:AAT family amino acid transporter
MVIMGLCWVLARNTFNSIPVTGTVDLDSPDETTSLIPGTREAHHKCQWTSDIVDIQTIDLYSDEYADEPLDEVVDETRRKRYMFLWRLYDVLV